MATLVSNLYLSSHSLPQEDLYDTDDAGAGEIYPILVPKSTVAWFNSPGEDNTTHRSWTGKHKDIERLRCMACGREFSKREDTLIARSTLTDSASSI